jgi:hypothetical protein
MKGALVWRQRDFVEVDVETSLGPLSIVIFYDVSVDEEYVDIEIEGVETSRECIPLDGVWRDRQLEDIVLECLEL